MTATSLVLICICVVAAWARKGKDWPFILLGVLLGIALSGSVIGGFLSDLTNGLSAQIATWFNQLTR